MKTQRECARPMVAAMLGVAFAMMSAPATAQDALPIRFFKKQIDFEAKNGTQGHHVKTDTISIKREHANAKAKVALVLCGFDVNYSDSDHQFRRLAINVEFNGPGPYTENVPIKVSLLLRDKNADDNFQGSVTVGVIVVDSDDVHVYADTKTFQQKSGAGPMKDNAYLAANVANVDRVALLRGFDISYGDSDHHVLAMDAAVQAATLPHQGAQFDSVTCELGLRDGSNNWDDLYGGSVSFSMLRFPKDTLHLDRGSTTVDGRGNPKSEIGNHSIEAPIKQENVFAALSGVHLAFQGDDHHVARMASSVEVASVTPDAQKTAIQVRYTGGIKDKNEDDSWRCRGEYVVFASK